MDEPTPEQWKRIFAEQVKDAIPLKQPIEICVKCREYDQSTEECYQVECILNG